MWAIIYYRLTLPYIKNLIKVGRSKEWKPEYVIQIKDIWKDLK
jgi:hypothetical protein